ncbi:MAG TPA: signal peptidase II, partial [Anaerolineaceae bacterium]|nr:signal peptidase II [Anaerolineaceae bacterium]
QMHGGRRLKRVLWMTALLIVLDQGTKLLARAFLVGQRFEILGGAFGLTYAENPGFWLDNGLARKYILLLQAITLFGLVALLGLWALYRRYYRRSAWMDVALACLLASAAGNMFLDRVIYGFVIDMFIIPYWVANMADLYSNLFILFFAVEFIVYPPGRRILSWTPPREWGRETRFFVRFLRRELLRWWQSLSVRRPA